MATGRAAALADAYAPALGTAELPAEGILPRPVAARRPASVLDHHEEARRGSAHGCRAGRWVGAPGPLRGPERGGGPIRTRAGRRAGASGAHTTGGEGTATHGSPETGRRCRTDGTGADALLGGAQLAPKSERRSRRSGANSDTRSARPLELGREVPDVVISRISEVASAVSCCAAAGPPSTARCRSRREPAAALPQLIAGTRALLRTIGSMSLPTVSCPTVTGAPYPRRASRHCPVYECRLSRVPPVRGTGPGQTKPYRSVGTLGYPGCTFHLVHRGHLTGPHYQERRPAPVREPDGRGLGKEFRTVMSGR